MRRKMLVVCGIVGMIMAISASPLVYAETNQTQTSENNSASFILLPDYTVFSPDKGGYSEGRGGGESYEANPKTGGITCGVTRVGKSWATQIVKIYLGRPKTLNIEARIEYLCSEEVGEWSEICKIWRGFNSSSISDFISSVLDPWLTWEQILNLFLNIALAFGIPVSSGMLAIALTVISWGITLIQLLPVVGERNFSTTFINFDFPADTGMNWIEVGLSCSGVGFTQAVAFGFVTQILVHGYAPPPAPSIELPDDEIPDTDTPYTFKFTSLDPNSDPVKYIIDWGDGTTEETGFNKSGNPTIELTHSYKEKREYIIKAKAIDCDGLSSEYSTKTFKVINYKPKIEWMKVYAPSLLFPDQLYEVELSEIPRKRECKYLVYITDLDNELVKVEINFGDRDIQSSEWTNGLAEFWHTYKESRSYEINITSTDIKGGVSNSTFKVYVKNSFPYGPSNPSPSNGATIYVNSYQNNINYIPSSYNPVDALAASIAEDIGLIGTINGITLSWQGGDPDGDNVTYYIYLGENSLNLIGTTENTCSYYYSELLISGKTYYWKVVAKDEYNLTVEGPIWHFNVEEENNNNLNADAINSQTSSTSSTAQSSKAQSTYILSASFSYSPSNPKVGQTVSFYDCSQGNIVSWQWNFGDGATSNQRNPSHAYSSTGTYSVTLTITDSSGRTASKTNQITVSNDNSYTSTPSSQQNNTNS